MDMDMEDSRSSSSHSIHSVAFHVYFAAVRTRRFAKNLIPSSPRISLVGVWFHVELLNALAFSSVEEVEEAYKFEIYGFE
ncbi:hypothetical protein Goarm_022237 [Gossypium armourianum]|uniref:Uncharacterized protein n=1 Tax=Gossypium armourianum TaxID=34283 RepID=A0A7J9KFN9_9ROSI|nr:hypothetical protein [Gossypium armourianum]